MVERRGGAAALAAVDAHGNSDAVVRAGAPRGAELRDVSSRGRGPPPDAGDPRPARARLEVGTVPVELRARDRDAHARAGGTLTVLRAALVALRHAGSREQQQRLPRPLGADGHEGRASTVVL